MENHSPVLRTLNQILPNAERDGYLTDAELNALSPQENELARIAVERTVKDKILHFLGSSHRVPEGAHGG